MWISLFLATRPKFLTTSVLPVLLGTVYGTAFASEFDGTAFALALGAVVLVHASVNVLNDVYDDISGNDGANQAPLSPYSGGSRVIQNGILDRDAMMRLGLVLLGLGIAVGFVLAALKGGGGDRLWARWCGARRFLFYPARLAQRAGLGRGRRRPCSGGFAGHGGGLVADGFF